MQEPKITTNLTITGTTTNQGADKVALVQTWLQGIAQIIVAVGEAVKPFKYPIIWLIIHQMSM